VFAHYAVDMLHFDMRRECVNVRRGVCDCDCNYRPRVQRTSGCALLEPRLEESTMMRDIYSKKKTPTLLTAHDHHAQARASHTHMHTYQRKINFNFEGLISKIM
jgi:hypothetical protein